MQQQEFTSIEDFVFNASFRDWLLHHNSLHKEYWENWMKENPGKINILNYAKGIVYALSVNHKLLPEGEIDKEIKAILSKAEYPDVQSKRTLVYAHKQRPVRLIHWLTGAAAAIIIIFSINYFKPGVDSGNKLADFYEHPSPENATSGIEQINNSDTIQAVALFDGSRVQLYPKSKISFSHGSFNKKREVHLTGEAFFDVQKNPAAPFYVYTKDLVTKVLGTSFIIKAYTSENKTSVLVKTGKVSVYKKENFSDKNTVANKLDGLIVTPNQQVIYDLAHKQLTKTIVDKPSVLGDNAGQTFVFNSTPLKEVFNILQNAYGITIMYDESVINSCSLSASMGNENFYEKLELICKTIDATYESIDGTIYITANGCN